MVFIKTEMILLLKFHPKLDGMSHQHQSHCTMCPIIIFFFKKKKIKTEKKNLKIFGVATVTPSGHFGGGEPPHGWMGVARLPPKRF
jgi:hypothetical protein